MCAFESKGFYGSRKFVNSCDCNSDGDESKSKYFNVEIKIWIKTDRCVLKF